MENQVRKSNASKPKTRKMYFSVQGMTAEEAAEMITNVLFEAYSSDPDIFTPKE